ncbi:MAG TPA: galactose-1-phosphate uridylyltransferase [Streptosporangiaceae bacterium]
MSEPVARAATTLADGRELIYFGAGAAAAASCPDRRQPGQAAARSQLRYDPLLGEWVIYASHRQDRTYLPAAADCPLCPSAPGRLTEIPAPGYQVAVFENRFPALPAETGGRCEMVCFSPEHAASFASLSTAQAAVILAAWTDRSGALSALPGVEQVYCFENRGAEIGATLSHPHGQIYAYPFVTPRTGRMLTMARAWQRDTGQNLFDHLLAAARGDRARVVLDGAHWTAFVPQAARWPYEVHLYPRRRVPDLAALRPAERAEFCGLYLDLLGRLDRLFDAPAPYIAGWHQAPAHPGREEFALHLELFTMRRAEGKLKYLAGSESGMGAFTNDVTPEAAAARLRQLG